MEAITFSITIVINLIVKSIKGKVSDFKNSRIVKAIGAEFESMKSASFVGIREYCNSSNEVANHVICCNFSYADAVKRDLDKLLFANEHDIQAIANEGNLIFPESLVESCIQKLADSFVKNSNPETRSKQSKGQTDAYKRINNCMRLNKETKLVYIYGLSVSKKILQSGEYKPKNSGQMVLCQNAIKKHFDFSTAKFRNFIVTPETLSSIRLNGSEFELI